ncbi:right-handed parallel beta-helix repeat-containing protein [Bdellovibrio bacteriovorus]|uniref:right-handed parallel beta-helix repeat-containing protein n=1 Tax=Bdellovibrio TaxID=958 RepID=UPI0035A8A77F
MFRSIAILGLFVVSGASAAPTCDATVLKSLTEPATEAAKSVSLKCSLKLSSSTVVTKQIIFDGEAASGVVLDCAGATLDGRGVNADQDMIMIRSKKLAKPSADGSLWSAPQDITIKNCKIFGSMRIYGMAKNGEGADLRESSRLDKNHTQRAQKNAPKNILLDNLTITGKSRVPLDLSPGVTKVTLQNSNLTGTSSSVAMYLDAESGFNIIRNNYIHVETESREQVAVDASAYNTITGNRFSGLNHGGIYLYRNCGEGGTIRHQSPTHNQILDNKFYYDKYKGSNPAVYLGSRNGNRGYCGDDEGFPWGSSVNNNDFATENIVANNLFRKRDPSSLIVQRSKPNKIQNNKSVDEFN